MNKMAVFLFALLFVLICSSGVFANDELPAKASHLSVGFNLNRFQDDFGCGLTVTTPYFVKDKFAMRLSGNLSSHEGVPQNKSESTWMTYTTLRFGVVTVAGMIAKSIRLYSEGGVVAIIPDSDLSDEENFGGYGVFGFEFFMTNSDKRVYSSYFIELGGIGTGATAEKISGKPFYSNGFMISVGWKPYF